MRKPVLPPLFAALSFLLCAFSAAPTPGSEAGFSLAMNVITDIDSDGSGTIQEEVIFPKETLDMMESSGASLDDLCNAFITARGGDFEWSKEERDDGTACLAILKFADLGELKSQSMDLFPSMRFNRLEIKEDHFYYDLIPNIDNTAEYEDVSVTVEALWILKVPGKVVETNADTEDGSTLTWDMMKLTMSSHFRAESKISGGGLFGLDPTLTILGAVGLMGCCCVVILAAGGAIFFFLRRKK